MKISRVLISFVGLAVLIAAGPATQISGTENAACAVDISSDMEWLMPNSVASVQSGLHRALADKAKTMLGIAPEDLPSHLSISCGPLGIERMGRVIITVSLGPDEPQMAKEFLDEAVAALPGAIYQAEMDPLKEQIDKTQKELTEESHESLHLRSVQNQLYAITQGIADPSSDGIHSLARNLDQQKQSLTMDSVAMSAEQDELAKVVDRINTQAEQKAQDDPIAKEMDTIVKLKQHKFEYYTTQWKNGTASQDQVDEANAQVAEARVQLLERREAVAHAAGGDTLVDLQKQMVQLEVNLAETKARLDAIDQQYSNISQAVQQIDALAKMPHAEDVAKEIASDEAALNDMRATLAKMRMPAVKSRMRMNPQGMP
jgi:hypothetical protein